VTRRRQRLEETPGVLPVHASSNVVARRRTSLHVVARRRSVAAAVEEEGRERNTQAGLVIQNGSKEAEHRRGTTIPKRGAIDIPRR
jgi:hypothetical protein